MIERFWRKARQFLPGFRGIAEFKPAKGSLEVVRIRRMQFKKGHTALNQTSPLNRLFMSTAAVHFKWRFFLS